MKKTLRKVSSVPNGMPSCQRFRRRLSRSAVCTLQSIAFSTATLACWGWDANLDLLDKVASPLSFVSDAQPSVKQLVLSGVAKHVLVSIAIA